MDEGFRGRDDLPDHFGELHVLHAVPEWRDMWTYQRKPAHPWRLIRNVERGRRGDQRDDIAEMARNRRDGEPERQDEYQHRNQDGEGNGHPAAVSDEGLKPSQHGPGCHRDRDGPDRGGKERLEDPDGADDNAARQQGNQNGPGIVLRTVLEKVWH